MAQSQNRISEKRKRKKVFCLFISFLFIFLGGRGLTAGIGVQRIPVFLLCLCMADRKM